MQSDHPGLLLGPLTGLLCPPRILRRVHP